MKSIPSFFIFVISGSAVIICYYGDKFLLFLYYKSPIARERFRLPLIRPSSTEPPAFSILAFYVLSSGLWSRLSSFASPFKLQTTDLESPSWRKVYLNFNGVTCVGHIDVIGSNKTHIRSASSLTLFLMFWSIFLLPHLLHNFGNFSFPLVRLQQLIHFQEDFLQSHLIIPLDIIFIHFKLIDKMPTHKSCYLGTFITTLLTSMTIKNSKKMTLSIRKHGSNVRIFHVETPT